MHRSAQKCTEMHRKKHLPVENHLFVLTLGAAGKEIRVVCRSTAYRAGFSPVSFRIDDIACNIHVYAHPEEDEQEQLIQLDKIPSIVTQIKEKQSFQSTHL